MLLAGSAHASRAGDCPDPNVSSFSRLARAVDDARAETGGKLLATWLIRPRDASRCRLVFRVDFLMRDGRVRSMNFDAATLDPVEIGDDRDWVEAGGGAGGQSAGGDGSQGTSGDDDHDDDDSDNSGPGSSSSGSGSGDDSDDSDDGDDGGNSGSGSGGSSGSGGDDSGGDDSGGGSGSGGSGSGGGDD